MVFTSNPDLSLKVNENRLSVYLFFKDTFIKNNQNKHMNAQNQFFMVLSFIFYNIMRFGLPTWYSDFRSCDETSHIVFEKGVLGIILKLNGKQKEKVNYICHCKTYISFRSR